MLPPIHRYGIDQWWERNCDAFIWKEAELRRKSVGTTREAIFYSERSSDQYEIFWVKFPEEFFHWIKRLQEAPEFQGQGQEYLCVGYRQVSSTPEAGLPSHTSCGFLG
jgi:hypothetical protein